jgi:hypothetical protein
MIYFPGVFGSCPEPVEFAELVEKNMAACRMAGLVASC